MVRYDGNRPEGTPVPKEINEQLWGKKFGLHMTVVYNDTEWLVASTLGAERGSRGFLLEPGEVIPPAFQFAELTLIPTRLIDRHN